MQKNANMFTEEPLNLSQRSTRSNQPLHATNNNQGTSQGRG